MCAVGFGAPGTLSDGWQRGDAQTCKVWICQFESDAVLHCFWFASDGVVIANGKQPGLHPGNAGSIPADSTNLFTDPKLNRM